MKKTNRKRYQDMTLDQLRQATKEYDKEMLNLPAKKPPANLAARHAKVMKRAKGEAKRRGRPTVGLGAASVLVSIERGLLREADNFRGDQLTRSDMVAAGLRLVMAMQIAAGLPPAELAKMTPAQVQELLSKSRSNRPGKKSA
jgi:hypothetical protein